ncbi:MAG: hypothetical protein LAO22_07100 [Acidobacteriia bacterium]|nr:hypothetical protein [Terriglobia bacterium]
MDPLLTNGIDPSLLRVVEKRGSEREAAPRRRRTAAPEKAIKDEERAAGEEDPETPKHALDDLA